MNHKSFAHQVVAITGASDGIGSALARVLAADRCKLGLIACNETRLEQLASDLRAISVDAAIVCADVAGNRNAEGVTHRSPG